MQTESAAGFYGKLPCKGDFLQRRVAQEFVDAWDPWLQQCLVSSREQLQDRWLDAYLTSPVWRFAVAEGVCGSGAYTGVMVPSVDRVGRYFPLTLVVQLNTQDCLLDLASEAVRQWFDSAESLVLTALQAHDLDLSLFDEQVAALGSPFHEADTAESASLRGLMQQPSLARSPASWQVPLQSVHSLQRAVNVFASRELERTLRPLTLWWTDGSEAVAPCWLCNRGLPPAGGFAEMIAGDGRAQTRAPTTAVEAVEVAQSPSTPELVDIVACHGAVSRTVESQPSVYFVSRTDVGLWGLANTQMGADILHDVPPAGSLTGLAEEVRRALEIFRHGDVSARAVALLRRANECAVVCAGEVQAVRVHAREVLNIEGTPPWAQGDHHRADLPPSAADSSLLDLIATAPEQAEAPVVHYDMLRNGDVWLLSGGVLFDGQRLASLPALVADQQHPDSAMLARIGRLLGLGPDVADPELPLMLLAALSS